MTVKITNITFKDDRAVVEVQANENLRPENRIHLKTLLYKKYPNIKRHACINSKGPKFDDCVSTTSIPHVLEHIILEELAKDFTKRGTESDLQKTSKKAHDQSSALRFPIKKNIFVAKTSNLENGVAKIELKYYDDISTLQAINRATESLNEMLLICKR